MRCIFAVFQNFPIVKKGVAQKTKFSISGGASSFRGDSRDILECPGSGIRFITITPILGQKSTSYDWAINHPAEVHHHTGAPLSTVLDFHLHYILIKPLSMLVTHYCKVLRKRLRCDWSK